MRVAIAAADPDEGPGRREVEEFDEQFAQLWPTLMGST